MYKECLARVLQLNTKLFPVSYYKSSSASETIIIVSACKKIFVVMIIETVTLFCSLYVIMIIGIGEL